MVRIVNKTPHPITLITDEGNITLQPEGEPIRLKQETEKYGEIHLDGATVPLTKTKFGKTENLPPEQVGVIYIVSLLVCRANPDRPDLYIVNETVRDEQGRIIGAKSLARNPFYK